MSPEYDPTTPKGMKTKAKTGPVQHVAAVPDVLAVSAGAAPTGLPPPGPIGLAAAAVDAADELAGLLVAADDPHRLARVFVRRDHHHPERPTLVSRGVEFLAWDGRLWADVTLEINKPVIGTVRAEFERRNRLDVAAFEALPADERKGKSAPTVRKTSTRLLGDVRLVLGALPEIALPRNTEGPRWLGGDGPWPASEVLAFPGRLVHLPSYAAGEDDFEIKPTPRFFSTTCLPFDFDPMAPEPALWLEFLDQILGTDRQAKDLIQEWFGYCLLPDTSLQKILMLVGPTRCGKGTIGRVLAGLLGPDSVAGPSFATLAGRFGAQSLVGKTLAVVGDARLSGKTDQAALLERLLMISGEDRIEVDIKHRPPWTGTLPTRLMLLTNVLPELRDAAMALANRLLIVQMKNCFLGREDTTLTKKLLVERPGDPALGDRGLAAPERTWPLRSAGVQQDRG